jgi:hypothetical protein
MHAYLREDYLLGGSTGDWTPFQNFSLARKALYSLSYTSTPFCFGYFWDRVSLFAQASLDHEPPIYASCYHWDEGS